MLNHRFNTTSPLTMGPSSGTAAYNAVLDSWEPLGWIYSMFVQCSYQIVAMGDGDTRVSTPLAPSSPVLTTLAYNTSDGAPVNPKQAGFNSPPIAGSLNNYGAWFTVTNPVGTPAEDRCYWTFQFGTSYGTIGASSYTTINIFWYPDEPDWSGCTPSRCPQGTVIEEEINEILMAGGIDTGYTAITDIYAHPTTVYSYPIASFNTLTYWNFGFDDDPARSVWWFIYWPQGGVGTGRAGATLVASDLAKIVPYGDRSRCVGVKVQSGTYGISEAGLTAGSRAFGRYDVLADVSVIATAYGGGDGDTVAYPATYAVALQRSTGAGGTVPSYNLLATTGRGTNTLGNGEEPLPVVWGTPDTMDQSRCGGRKGDSELFFWNTNGAATQLTKATIGSKSYVLFGQLWTEINDGASPGLAGAAFSL